jgi:DNA segregation ATPase FtsK/SpoIIIE, S-DNA-T family
MAEHSLKKPKSGTKKAENDDFKTEPKLKSSTKNIPFYQDEKYRRIVGLFFLLIAGFVFISCFSYISTWKGDQDKLINNSIIDYLFATPYDAANKAGKIGAMASHLLIYGTIGLFAFLLVPFFAGLGYNLFGPKYRFKAGKYLLYCLGITLIGAPLLAYIKDDDFSFSHGGGYGAIIVNFLNSFAGKMGTGVLLFGALASYLIYHFNHWLSIPKIPSLPKFTSIKTSSDSAIENASGLLQNAVQSLNNDDYEHGEASLQVHTSQDKKRKEIKDEDLEFQINDAQNIQEDSLPFVVTQTENIDDLKAIEASDKIALNTTVTEQPKTLSNADLELEVVDVPAPEEKLKNEHIAVANADAYDSTLDLSDYKFPTIDLLDDRSNEGQNVSKEELEANKNQIIQTLKNFGISIAKISATVGPTVTLYEIVPSEGVRISKIRNLEDDIALSLAALGIRIIAPIPGKGTIGIEVPNLKKQMVSMRGLIASEKFINNNYSLPIALGKRIDNENYIVDLATMPHLLMAGATGQGKSVGLNAILTSLLYKKHPSQLKFVLVDPKKVELSIYKLIEKHFLAKLPDEEEAIITDTKKVVNTLNSLCIEMDNRYDLLKEASVRNIKEYNEKFVSRRLNPAKGHRFLPFIVLVVDEFADLIMTAGKEVEIPIARLAQLARAIGIHLIIATQRPSVNVITGTIKANFPARIAFRVASKIDSRTILDAGGAEQLIGRGDMLINSGNELTRVQCAFVDTPEVERIIEFIGNQRGYPTAYELPEYVGADADFDGGGKSKNLTDVDAMFGQCARLVVTSNSGSTSMLQRRFNLGYNRAGRIMDQLESAGVVGPASGGKPRELYVKTESELDTLLAALNINT